MKKVLTAFRTLLHPPRWVLLFFPPVVFAALILVFLKGWDGTAAAYIVYPLSAYCLTVLVLPMPQLLKKAKTAVMRRVTATAFGEKYVNDPAFRGSVGLCQGVAVDFFYALFRVAVGIRYASVWSVSMAVYYLVLGIMRLSLVLQYRRREEKTERRCYRRTAKGLFVLNLPMGGMILLTVLQNSGYAYPGYVIYLSAMYTFYTAILSVVNLVKFRKRGSPILSAAKALNFVAALMSLFGLQTAMIVQFSKNGEPFRKMMNAVTGGGVWLSVILTALYMLLHSRKMKAEVKNPEPLGK